MKVLAILTGKMHFDGITNSVLNYYRAMERSDMQIGIVSARGTDYEMKKSFEDIGCMTYILENRDSDTIKYFFRLVQIIKKEKYDIVHVHGNSATLAIETTAALLAGCKIRIVHSRNSFCEHVKADKVLRPLLYATYTDGFACGEKAGKWLFGNRSFTIINNGKNIEKFLFKSDIRAEYRQKLKVDDNQVLLGHVGLFHRQKNHSFLIKVFAKICEKNDRYRLVLIGDGEGRPDIEKLVQEKRIQDKVYFLGSCSNIEKWLQALDVMVFPSLFEGMPNVVLEWQIAGLPAIISDTITKECKIMNSVKYLPLEAGSEVWAEEILKTEITDRNKNQEEIYHAFEKAGFDINRNAVMLKRIYMELLEKRE